MVLNTKHNFFSTKTYLLTVRPVAIGILKFNVVVTGLLPASGCLYRDALLSLWWPDTA